MKNNFLKREQGFRVSQEEQKEHRLEFPSPNKLFGRDSELKQLRGVYERLGRIGLSEITLVAGVSGMGKSSLVRGFLDQLRAERLLSSDDNIHVLEGKYDIHSNNKPFSAIQQALTQFCLEQQEQRTMTTGANQQSTTSSISRIPVHHRIRSALGEDGIEILSELVPSLKDLVDFEHDDALLDASMSPTTRLTPTDETSLASRALANTPSEYRSHRLGYFLRTFLQAIPDSKSSILILFLDDIQWADVASLNLLTSLMTDLTLKNVWVLGTYRSDEVEHNEPLQFHWKTVSKAKILTRIQVSELSVDAVTEYISETLRVGPTSEEGLINGSQSTLEQQQQLQENVQILAQKIYTQVGGNVFWIKQSLEELSRTAIRKNPSNNLWRIDMAKVEEYMEQHAHDGVVMTIVVKRLQSELSKDQQLVLALASLIGSTFVGSELVTLACHMAIECDDDDEGDEQEEDRDEKTEGSKETLMQEHAVIAAIERAVRDEFLVTDNRSETTYVFSHDRIQQAAMCLLPEDQKETILFQVARHFLLRADTPEGRDWMPFVAADHFNSLVFVSADGDQSSNDPVLRRNLSVDIDLLMLTKLNLRVGLEAAGVAAIVPAAQYLTMAVIAWKMYTSNKPWEYDYDLTLELYRHAADSLLASGDLGFGRILAEEVIERAKTLQEKIPAFTALAEALGRVQKHQESMDLIVSVAKKVGVFPRRFFPVKLVREFMACKKTVSRLSDDDILDMTVVDDESELNEHEILAQMQLRAHFVGREDLLLWGLSRQLNISFRKQRICGRTAYALAAFGCLMLIIFGDLKAAIRFSDLSKRLVELTNDTHSRALVLVSTAFFCDAWTRPLPMVVEQMQRAHEFSLRSGDLTFSHIAWFVSQMYAYATGQQPLLPIRDTLETMVTHMGCWGVKHVQVRVLLFLVSQLMEQPDGEPDWKELDRIEAEENDTSELAFINGCWCRLQLAYHFANLKTAYSVSRKLMTVVHKDFNYSTASIAIFFSGLTACAMARESKVLSFKYKKEAQRIRKRFEKLLEGGGTPNVQRYHCLNAECMGLAGASAEEVLNEYDLGIRAATRAGFLPDAALAHELSGNFLLKRKRVDDARYHLNQAYALYSRWGAMAKACSLQAKHSTVFTIDGSDTKYSTRELQPQVKSSITERTFWVSGDGFKALGSLEVGYFRKRTSLTASARHSSSSLLAST
ncbi:Protein tyrosine kinase [Seminavis robusta]|uniref:Protein tyrosine kinase n=1 Tax=Seminavis robusta TaxID=568900 RepID=A0A9N8H5T1_9STRA|nr:Protein tyrosine kinase [Seminavis robusta]|eukprot:Sro30_g019700.1 Protein tyrosine kinase (1197) ;mRNA; r:97792-101382